MNSNTFRALLRFLNPPKHDYKGGRIQVASSKMLAMTLNFLGSQTTIRQIAIKWPNKEDYADIAAKFNKPRVR